MQSPGSDDQVIWRQGAGVIYLLGSIKVQLWIIMNALLFWSSIIWWNLQNNISLINYTVFSNGMIKLLGTFFLHKLKKTVFVYYVLRFQFFREWSVNLTISNKEKMNEHTI